MITGRVPPLLLGISRSQLNYPNVALIDKVKNLTNIANKLCDAPFYTEMVFVSEERKYIYIYI